ncbi:MAG: hypothetical protein KCHDKBKB_01321 [Elusimicrobia bacterium]|nr:hypothetical protein [Elusimicrobiota bacterium]
MKTSPLKSIFNFRVVLILIATTALGFGVFLYLAWTKVEARIKSPGFKTGMEKRISIATGAETRIGLIAGHLGLRPWMSAHDVSLVFPEDVLRMNAVQLRFDLKILPLLKGDIVFSRIGLDRPKIIYRQPKRGDPYGLPIIFSQKSSHIQSMRIEALSLKEGRVTIVDSSTSSIPVVELEANASTRFSPKTKTYDLRLNGKFSTMGATGPFEVKGELFPTLEWKMNVLLKNPVSRGSSAPLPLRIDAVVLSSGPMVIAADWKSSLSPATAEIRMAQWRDSNYTFRINIWGGTVTGNGSWKMRATPRSPVFFSIRAQGDKLRVENILALTVSTVPWTGGFNFDLALNDFPVYQIGRWNTVAALDSLSKSRSANLEIRGDASFQEKSPLKDIVGTLRMDPAGRVFIAGLEVNWEGGGLTGGASLPHISRSKATGPLDVAMTINNLDLTFLPGLAKRLNLSRGKMSADIKWSANPIDRGMFQAFAPNVAWSVDGRFQELMWRNIPFDDVGGRVNWDQSEVQLENIRGSVSSGTFLVSGSLSNRMPDGFHRFASSATITNIEVEPFMFEISTNPILRRGRWSSKVSLAGHLKPWDPDSLSGHLSLAGRKGRIRAGSFSLALLNRLNLKSLIDSMTGRLESGFPFEVIDATGSIGGGRITFNNPVCFKSPHLEIVYTGWAGADLKSAEGVMAVNPLVGTRNLLTAIPGVSTLMLGPNGELLPLIVDVNYKQGRLDTKFRSIQTLADLPMRIIGNVIRLPASLFGGRKKSPASE